MLAGTASASRSSSDGIADRLEHALLVVDRPDADVPGGEPVWRSRGQPESRTSAATPTSSGEDRTPGRRTASPSVGRLLQSGLVRAVLVPERFRGGCPFGADRHVERAGQLSRTGSVSRFDGTSLIARGSSPGLRCATRRRSGASTGDRQPDREGRADARVRSSTSTVPWCWVTISATIARPRPVPWMTALRALRGPEEPVEQLRQLVGRDADAGVAHPDHGSRRPPPSVAPSARARPTPST